MHSRTFKAVATTPITRVSTPHTHFHFNSGIVLLLLFTVVLLVDRLRRQPRFRGSTVEVSNLMIIYAKQLIDEANGTTVKVTGTAFDAGKMTVGSLAVGLAVKVKGDTFKRPAGSL